MAGQLGYRRKRSNETFSTSETSVQEESARAAEVVGSAETPNQQLFDNLDSNDLATVLSEASRIQQNRELSSLDQALETARELGIDEKHVVAAAEKLQRHKARLARLRTVTRRRRAEFLRFAGLLIIIPLFVMMVASTNAAQAVLFGMSIAAFIMGIKWFRAWIAEKKPDLFEADTEPGDCRVCGASAVHKKGHYCRDHKPA